MCYNENNITIIADNSVTAMTGHQQHPGTGITLRKKHQCSNLEKLVQYRFSLVDVNPTAGKYEQVLKDHLQNGETFGDNLKRPCDIY